MIQLQRLLQSVVIPCVSFALISVHDAARAEFPPPPAAPKGYSWRTFSQIHAKFLVPDGWFVKEVSQGGTRAVFITKESIDREGAFKTGLSVNVLYDPKPSLFAQRTIDGLKTQSQRFWGIGDIALGALKGRAGFFKFPAAGYDALINETLIFGNDTTGTCYLIVFESPAAEWAPAPMVGGMLTLDVGYAHSVGRVLLTNLVLDESF